MNDNSFEKFQKLYPGISKDVYDKFVEKFPQIDLSDNTIVSTFIAGYFAGEAATMKA